jgi:D-glycero-D-manno-heptose 1,7-bisphosphate phosphatase
MSNFDEIQYVFLDRDGVVNRPAPNNGFVTCWEQFELLPGVPEAMVTLNQMGRKVIIATNQRGVALGLFSQAELDHLHFRLKKSLASRGARLDAVYSCPHDKGQCFCRKPLPGLFEQAFRDFPGASPGNSIVIGDSLSDIEAGANAGMRTIFIASEKLTQDQKRAAELANAIARSLADAVNRYFGPCVTASR